MPPRQPPPPQWRHGASTPPAGSRDPSRYRPGAHLLAHAPPRAPDAWTMSVRSTAAPFHHERPAPLAGSARDSVEQRRTFPIYATRAIARLVPTARVETEKGRFWQRTYIVPEAETLAHVRDPNLIQFEVTHDYTSTSWTCHEMKRNCRRMKGRQPPPSINSSSGPRVESHDLTSGPAGATPGCISALSAQHHNKNPRGRIVCVSICPLPSMKEYFPPNND